jgi:hypothetical protein
MCKDSWFPSRLRHDDSQILMSSIMFLMRGLINQVKYLFCIQVITYFLQRINTMLIKDSPGGLPEITSKRCCASGKNDYKGKTQRIFF